MLLLKLKNESLDKVAYNYFPEKKDTFGILEISKKTGDIEIIKVAENDQFRIYLNKAASKLSNFFENKKYEDESIVAWY